MNSIELSGDLVVVTGAGISLASGIPTFRGKDPDAIWSKDVTDLATNAFFRNNPVEFWQWYLHRFGSILEKEPNAAHFALADLEKSYPFKFTLVTQNVDTLHEQAGSKPIKAHGSADRVRCSSDYGCLFGSPNGLLTYHSSDWNRFLDHPTLDNLPKCPRCHSILRPHALLFDEFYEDHCSYQFDAIQEAVYNAKTVLFVGTSFSVSLTDAVMGIARSQRAHMISVDPHHVPPNFVQWIRQPSETYLPTLTLRTSKG